MPNKQGLNNVFLTNDEIANEALRLLENNLIAARFVNRNLEPKFGSIGDTISVKKPYRVKSASGRVLVKQPMVDQTVPFKIDRQEHVGLEFTVNDRTLSINDFSERYLKSAVVQLAHKVDYSIWDKLANTTFFTTGTPGGKLGYDQIIDAAAYSRMTGHPDDGSTKVGLNPLDAAEFRKKLAGGVNEELAKSSIQRAWLSNVSGMDLFETAQMPTHQVGVATGTPLVNGGGQTGDTLVTKGWTNSTTGILKAGDVITIANVYSINPQTYLSTGILQQFVVLLDVNSGASTGPASLKISPAINDGTLTTTDAEGNSVSLAAYQNVTNAPAADAPITVLGTGGSVYRQNFMLHKDALTLAVIDLNLPSTAPVAVRKRHDKSGLSIAMTGQYNITDYKETFRLDVLWGVQMMYPELSRRILGAAS